MKTIREDEESDGGLIPVHRYNIDKCKMFMFAISIGCRIAACYYLSISGKEFGMPWRRVLVFAYVALQFAFLIHEKANDMEARRRGYIQIHPNPNTKKWWKSYQHLFLIVAVGYVNFDNEYFVAWLGADIGVSCILYFYYRIYRILKLK